MIIVNNNHGYGYDMENLAEIFFPSEKIKMVNEMPQEKDRITVYTEITEKEAIVEAFVYDRYRRSVSEIDENSDRQNVLSVLFYRVISEIMQIEYPWGILYGVRPARFFHSLCDKFGEDTAKNILKEKYLVSEDKISLVSTVAENESKIISLSRKDSFSLYISIPFCPTRCKYCSFVSHSIEQTQKLVDDYVALLVKEIAEIGRYAKSLSLRLETIYFGGGTPTILSPQNLSLLFNAIEKNFDLSTLREYTVEAGRPDTVTVEKMNTLKSAGVGRISINPQSFNDEVLNAIGRRHTSECTLKAFDIARNCGFDNINMDFIAGLEKDNLNSFKNSIETALSLNAESITVHTLCMKSGSYLVTEGEMLDSSDKKTAFDMVAFSRNRLTESGYIPYYMYRQGKSLGNLENVGWCVEGKECLYNVFMMDETHTVFAAGAGAVTRLKNPENGKIERIYNYKYPYEYIGRFDEMISRKKKIGNFYENINLL